MGLGLLLAATPQASNCLDVVERYLRTRCANVLETLHRSDGGIYATLHPAAEAVEFTLDGQQLVVSAKSSTVGPGYHVYLCELLHDLEGELGGVFASVPDGDEAGAGDETGYFTSGDRAALESEMLTWLRSLADHTAGQIAEGSCSHFTISMSIDESFEFDGALATPMGPRSGAWLEATRELPRNGIDIFPWWETGLGAEHALGRALVRMWKDVRWRPQVDKGELALLEKIDEDLCRAHDLDPALPLPWAEWAAILDFMGREDPFARQVEERASGLSPSIGYRRRPVRVTLTGRWSVRIPGEMAVSFDKDGVWCGFMPGRTVWMSSYKIGDPKNPTLSAAETLTSEKPGEVRFELPPMPGEYAGRASLATADEGDTTLSVQIALPHRLAIFTFVLDHEADLGWAREVAGSIRGRTPDA